MDGMSFLNVSRETFGRNAGKGEMFPVKHSEERGRSGNDSVAVNGYNVRDILL